MVAGMLAVAGEVVDVDVEVAFPAGLRRAGNESFFILFRVAGLVTRPPFEEVRFGGMNAVVDG